MTLIEWLSTRLRRAMPGPERPAAVVPTQRPKPRVPPEYMALYTYLESRYATTVVLTFEQMEALLGHALPEPASTDREWWTAAARADRHSDTWTMAQRTATPNLLARNVAFERAP